MLGLKRLLDGRAGGLIDFFLSSDDDSIAHGTIWPAEVKAALDRMSLMLIFVSPEALKSGWTYFEAGYGLHKLQSAKIYCLPGIDKGALPPPFNILQNRNLHSIRDIGLLIKQANEELDASLKESVSKEEFDQIFKKPSAMEVNRGPSLERLVNEVTVSILGPSNSAEIFSDVCQKRGLIASRVPYGNGPRSLGQDEFFSTGLRLTIEQPNQKELLEEIEITPELRSSGTVHVKKLDDHEWRIPSTLERYWEDSSEVTVAEVEKYNEKIRNINQGIVAENEVIKSKPRQCRFELAATNISVPIGLVDDWIVAAKIESCPAGRIKFSPEVRAESRVETIAARVYGTDLSLRFDGSYSWKAKIVVTFYNLRNDEFVLNLSAENDVLRIGDFHIPELVSTLFELNVISLQKVANRRR